MSYHDRYEAYRYYAEANLLHKAYMETASFRYHRQMYQMLLDPQPFSFVAQEPLASW